MSSSRARTRASRLSPPRPSRDEVDLDLRSALHERGMRIAYRLVHGDDLVASVRGAAEVNLGLRGRALF
jgi:hypothetical protein